MAMTSRERVMTAIECGTPDYVPMSHLFDSFLRKEGEPITEFLGRQMDMGMDPVVNLVNHGVKSDFLPGPEVSMREWVESRPGARYPLLHKEYSTPAGPLTCVVNKSHDWKFGDHLPDMNDLVIPRAEKRLVTSGKDLPALRHAMKPMSLNDKRFAAVREAWDLAKAFAREHNLPVRTGYTVLGDAAAWLCGHEGAIFMAVDEPDAFDELLDIIEEYDRPILDEFLAERPDILFRRAWYEGADFWSPALWKKFFLPRLAREAEYVHDCGVKLGYLNTSGTLPLMDLIMEAGVDVIGGVDPVQGLHTEMAKMKARAKGRVALWGGLNVCLTLARGNVREVRDLVKSSVEAAGPDGFILSAPDSLVEDSDKLQRNIEVMLQSWKECR